MKNRLLPKLALVRKIGCFQTDFLKNFESICKHMVEKFFEKDAEKSHFNNHMEFRKKSNIGYRLIVAFFLCFASCQGGMPTKKSTTLFSIDAEEVNILPLKTPLKRYKITVRDQAEDVLVLDGRPIYKAWTLSSKEFIELCTTSKSELVRHPPHLTLIVYAPHHRGYLERVAVLFKINQIEYHGDKKEMVLDATALSDVKPYMIGHPMKLADFLLEMN